MSQTHKQIHCVHTVHIEVNCPLLIKSLRLEVTHKENKFTRELMAKIEWKHYSLQESLEIFKLISSHLF